MKSKVFTLLLGVVTISAVTSGQEYFRFENQLNDTARFDLDPQVIGNHYLGEQLALKYSRIQETYTYEQQGTVTNPVTRTVVMKPAIYYSLKKLNSYYRKQLKKGKIDSSEAIRQLGWYFDIGFAIHGQNTTKFEDALQEARKPDRIAELFTQVVLE
jgi:hypothetical protein